MSEKYFYIRERGESIKSGNMDNLGPETEEGMAVRQLEAFEEYIEILSHESGGDLERVREQLKKEVTASNEYVKKLEKLVDRVFSWVKMNNMTPLEFRRLGGGFVNPVILITTLEGRQFVAKAFMDNESAEVTDEAKKKLTMMAEGDQKFIPDIITWLDDDSVVSEKAEGFAIRVVIEKLSKGEMSLEKSEESFFNLGELLGQLHSRSLEFFVDNNKTVANVDVDRLINKHIDDIAFLFDSSFVDKLKKKIAIDFKPDNISFVHGDAHLDNFFVDPFKSKIQIVDYDDLRLGDPNADVGRALASVEIWLSAYDIDPDYCDTIKKAFLAGYGSKRPIENINEINMMRLRLFVVQLRSFFASELGQSVFEKFTQSHKPFVEVLNDIRRLNIADKEDRSIKQTLFSYREIIEYLSENYTSDDELVSDESNI